MKKLISLLAFSGATALAAPPVIGPGGLTPQQIITHRQGVDIGPRHSAAQSVAGSRLDEFAAINPGSSQARFLFNTTVVNVNNQSPNQPAFPSANNLNSTYLNLIEKNPPSNLSTNTYSNPFSPRLEKSQLQGMVFLKPNRFGVEPFSDQQNLSDSFSRINK
jgi:hypothetical protein